MEIIVAKNLKLKQLLPNMADELYSVVDANREYLREHLGWVNLMKNSKDELNFINSINNNSIDTFAIFFNDKIVGTIDFHSYNDAKTEADIGYWLAENFQGRGIVTESCRTFIKYGFEELKLNKIILHANIKNAKSEAVAKRLGFTFVVIDKNHSHMGDGSFLDAKRFELRHLDK